MRTLMHMPLDPASRTARLLLAEKGLPARFEETPPWSEHQGLARANPALTVPVLFDEAPSGGEVAVAPISAIIEYLDEVYRTPAFLPATSAARAETRRLCSWFGDKFETEVNRLLVRERIDARLATGRRHDRDAYAVGLEALSWHLDYLSWLLEGRAWLAGEKLTVADLAAAGHLSANDYIGAVPWADFPLVKEWYAKVKCRPSFRPLLADRIEGIAPAAHYDDLDF